MSDINELFNRIDADGSGGISSQELALHLLGTGMNPDAVSGVFASLDVNGDGNITRSELKAAINDPSKAGKEMRAAMFKPLDGILGLKGQYA